MPEPWNGEPTDRPVIVSTNAGSYVVVTATGLDERARDRIRRERLHPAAELPHHLAVAERDLDGLLEREIPDLVVVGVLERERGGAVHFDERRFVDVRILDLGGNVQIVRQVAVFAAIERLLRGTRWPRSTR